VLKVCMISAEFSPLAKTGGLADVVAGLSRYLAGIGQDVRVFLPRYDAADERGVEARPVDFARSIEIDMGGRRLAFSLVAARPPGREDWIYLIDCPELYHRGGLYTSDGDEHVRFAFLARAALASCQHMGWGPDIVHAHDWHAALAPLYLKTLYAWDGLFAQTRSVLTIHNLGYQGVFGRHVVGELGLADHASHLHNEDLDHGVVNFLKNGLIYADVLTTVSRTYAGEIQGEELGFGLHELLRSRADHLVGIVNGADYGEWNPETDARLPHHYSVHDLGGKRANTSALLSAMGLPPRNAAPVFGIVSRLTGTKGFEIVGEPLAGMMRHHDARLVVLGSGEPRFEDLFQWLQHTFPRQVCYYRGYHEDLAHLIQAGSDAFLMPSRTEPCGLTQLYSMKYGTVPIVHRTGGLADTVEPFDPVTGQGTGIVFEDFDENAVRWALDRALQLFADPPQWHRMMRNGMDRDFSWDRQGRLYLELYDRLHGA
jgi:starch synthase